MIKKIAKSFLLSFLLINLGLTVAYGAVAYGFDAPNSLGTLEVSKVYIAASTGDPLGDLNAVGGQTGLESFQTGQHAKAPVDFDTPGVGAIGSVGYMIIDIVKLLMSSIAVLMIVIYGVRMIVGGSNEEDMTKVKKGLAVAILGLVVIQLADVLVKEVFFGEGARAGEVFESETSAKDYALRGLEQLDYIIGAIQYLLGSIAVLVIIINGIKIMTTGGEEENRKKALKNIGLAAGGLIIVLLSKVIVMKFIYPDLGESTPDPEAAKELFAMISNFIAGFIGVIAFVMLLVAGYTYVVAGSEETAREKVKKLLLGAIIGIILSLGAYAITNTIITFEEENEFIPETATQLP